MSQAGRYAHKQNQKRHAQRTSGVTHQRQAETVETATWLPAGMAACRMLAEQHKNLWVVTNFSMWCEITDEEAERRLRYMSQLGFLRMAYSKELGQFTWNMAQPDLPTKEDLR